MAAPDRGGATWTEQVAVGGSAMSPDGDLSPDGGVPCDGGTGERLHGVPEDGVPIVLTVVLKRSTWLRGELAAGGGPPDQFEGWLGLMALIERVRSSNGVED